MSTSCPCCFAFPFCLVFLLVTCRAPPFFFFFFNDTATTEIYTLSLHDALPILRQPPAMVPPPMARWQQIITQYGTWNDLMRPPASKAVVMMPIPFCESLVP